MTRATPSGSGGRARRPWPRSRRPREVRVVRDFPSATDARVRVQEHHSEPEHDGGDGEGHERGVLCHHASGSSNPTASLRSWSNTASAVHRLRVLHEELDACRACSETIRPVVHGPAIPEPGPVDWPGPRPERGRLRAAVRVDRRQDPLPVDSKRRRAPQRRRSASASTSPPSRAAFRGRRRAEATGRPAPTRSFAAARSSSARSRSSGPRSSCRSEPWRFPLRGPSSEEGPARRGGRGLPARALSRGWTSTSWPCPTRAGPRPGTAPSPGRPGLEGAADPVTTRRRPAGARRLSRCAARLPRRAADESSRCGFVAFGFWAWARSAPCWRRRAATAAARPATDPSAPSTRTAPDAVRDRRLQPERVQHRFRGAGHRARHAGGRRLLARRVRRAGSSTSLEDATDVPSGMGPGNVGSCTGSTPTQTPKAEGTTCATDGGTVCDGQGACVECVVDGDCTSNLCVDGTCAPVTCTNLVKDGEETDVDCGGTQCLPCADTKACLVDADCESDVCTCDARQAPTCSDTTSNGDETGVDCGGPDCPTCMNGQACAVDADCTNDSCVNLVCADPTCTDLSRTAPRPTSIAAALHHQVHDPGYACALDTDCVGQMRVVDVCTQINGCDAANTEDHTSQANVTVTQQRPDLHAEVHLRERRHDCEDRRRLHLPSAARRRGRQLGRRCPRAAARSCRSPMGGTTRTSR